jgi:hypothetical protein
MTLAIVLAVSLPPFVGLLLVSFRLFDQLLRIQVSEARAEWEAFGRPSGYFWKPIGSEPLTLREKGYIWTHWFWNRPLWVDSTAGSSRVYARFIIMAWLATLAFMPVFLAACLITTMLILWPLRSLQR